MTGLDAAGRSAAPPVAEAAAEAVDAEAASAEVAGSPISYCHTDAFPNIAGAFHLRTVAGGWENRHEVQLS